MNATSLSLPARAKLNLVLRIVGRRQDGYHLLDTLFHALELHDDLVLSLAPQGIALTVTAEHPSLQVAPGPDNLVERALRRFADAAGYRDGFAAQLHKRIPHGGGLGGGSSDAAAALRLANELLGRPLTDAALARLGVALGADVPFFFRGGSQWGRGIGDELSPANVAPRWFVLLVPPFGCPTVDVYKSYAALWKSSAAQSSVGAITVPDTGDSAVRIAFHNDLESAAERVRPELADLRRRVVGMGFDAVRMTGSGSTLFVVGDDEAAAQRAAATLAPLQAHGVRLLVTRSASAGVDVPRPPDRPDGPRAANP
jgi:4-diphosphocytidyl-2-C-methyl-D-erythritol kinase